MSEKGEREREKKTGFVVNCRNSFGHSPDFSFVRFAEYVALFQIDFSKSGQVCAAFETSSS